MDCNHLFINDLKFGTGLGLIIPQSKSPQTMIRNYLKTAYRSLLKNKGFTAINVLGLALGLATCLLIVFYVFDELSYDHYNKNIDRIYRVNSAIRFGGISNTYAVSPAPTAAALKSDFPEVEQVVRFRSKGGNQVKKSTQNIQEDMMLYADPSVFSVFTLPMIDGNPATALKDPHTVVITETIAKKYFNKTDVVGQTLVFNDTSLYKVTGVIKDIPQQSHFRSNFLISMSTLPEARDNMWFSNNFNTYVLLRPGASYKSLEAKFPAFLRSHAGAQLQSIIHISYDKFEQSGNYFKFSLMPLKDIHLRSNAVGELGMNGNIQYVYIFSIIAVFILLIACVNFMNLSTARSANRAREVGVRKVLGSAKKHLVFQFLTESIIVTLVAAILAMAAAWVLLGRFNELSGKTLIITPHMLAWLAPGMLLMVIVIGFIAGSYPAFYLSGFSPISVLKGKISAGFKSGFFRSFLVVFQFCISIFLIIGTLVVYNQLSYIRNKDLGYDRDHVVIIHDTWTLGSKARAFKQEIKQLSGVKDATLTEALPNENYGNSSSVFKDPVIDLKRAVLSQIWNVDEDYIPTLGMKMKAGRNFSSQMPTDSDAIIINQAAARLLDFKSPLNQLVYQPQDNMIIKMKAYHIIGVVKDFNFNSLRDNVTPVMLFLKQNNGNLSVRIN
jgi:putative ABC transport system permease protein